MQGGGPGFSCQSRGSGHSPGPSGENTTRGEAAWTLRIASLPDQAARRAPRGAVTRGQSPSVHAPGQEPTSRPPAATAALSHLSAVHSAPTKCTRPEGRGSWDPRRGGAAPAPALPGSRPPLRSPRPPSWFQLAHRSVAGVTGLRTQPERLRAARRRWSCRRSLSHLKAAYRSGKGTAVRDLQILCFKTNLGSSLRARVMLPTA